MATLKTIRTDKARVGDLIAGTGASGNYDDGSRRIESITRAPEHEKRADRMTAWLITWSNRSHNVYYGDTQIILQQRL